MPTTEQIKSIYQRINNIYYTIILFYARRSPCEVLYDLKSIVIKSTCRTTLQIIYYQVIDPIHYHDYGERKLVNTIWQCHGDNVTTVASQRSFNPFSPQNALKHNFTSLKTDLIFLQRRVLEPKFPGNWFTNTWYFSWIFKPHQVFFIMFIHYKSRIAAAIRGL